jgi:cytochrome oxidase Cu insertion factor (SCO1/SenC/PrrC family)
MMHPRQKAFVTLLWAFAVLAMISVVGAGLWARRQDPTDTSTDGEPPRLGILYNAPAFSLTDQHGKPVTDADLRGNIWVAMVFFTECPGVCPMMTARISQLQKSIHSPDVKIASFSIDPEHDTPEKLNEYAQRLEADQSRWYFLTGPKRTMYETAKAYGLAATPAEDGKPITHTQKVLLIDRDNRVRAFYDTNDDDSMNQLSADIRALAGMRSGA